MVTQLFHVDFEIVIIIVKCLLLAIYKNEVSEIL